MPHGHSDECRGKVMRRAYGRDPPRKRVSGDGNKCRGELGSPVLGGDFTWKSPRARSCPVTGANLPRRRARAFQRCRGRGVHRDESEIRKRRKELGVPLLAPSHSLCSLCIDPTELRLSPAFGSMWSFAGVSILQENGILSATWRWPTRRRLPSATRCGRNVPARSRRASRLGAGRSRKPLHSPPAPR